MKRILIVAAVLAVASYINGTDRSAAPSPARHLAEAMQIAYGTRFTPAEAPIESPVRTSKDDARDEIVGLLHAELRRVGCYHGLRDAAWGHESMQAMKAFNAHVNATLSVDRPDAILLTLVRGFQGEACTTPCVSGRRDGPSGRCRAAIVAVLTPPPASSSIITTDARASHPSARAMFPAGEPREVQANTGSSNPQRDDTKVDAPQRRFATTPKPENRPAHHAAPVDILRQEPGIGTASKPKQAGKSPTPAARPKPNDQRSPVRLADQRKPATAPRRTPTFDARSIFDRMSRS